MLLKINLEMKKKNKKIRSRIITSRWKITLFLFVIILFLVLLSIFFFFSILIPLEIEIKKKRSFVWNFNYLMIRMWFMIGNLNWYPFNFNYCKMFFEKIANFSMEKMILKLFVMIYLCNSAELIFFSEEIKNNLNCFLIVS